jgi:hypothetical protein
MNLTTTGINFNSSFQSLEQNKGTERIQSTDDGYWERPLGQKIKPRTNTWTANQLARKIKYQSHVTHIQVLI